MMHRSAVHPFLSLAFVALSAHAPLAQETGTISGTVVDSASGAPIEGAQVRVTGTAFGNITRANGQFAILNVPPGLFSVEAQANGYGTVRVTNVDVRADVNRLVSFVLSPTVSRAETAMSATQRYEQALLDAMNVRMFTLQHLSNGDAAKLVAPFVRQPIEGVFDPGDAVRGVTVRATPKTLAVIDSLLAVHDRPMVTINLRFQVIAATDSAVRDPRVDGELVTALREALPFAGYQLVARTTIAVAPVSRFSTAMAGDGEQLRLSGELTNIGMRATPARSGARAPEVAVAHLSVHLNGLVQQGAALSWVPLVSTALGVPIGQTVVIGSAAAGHSTGPQRRVLILVVSPEVRDP